MPRSMPARDASEAREELRDDAIWGTMVVLTE